MSSKSILRHLLMTIDRGSPLRTIWSRAMSDSTRISKNPRIESLSHALGLSPEVVHNIISEKPQILKYDDERLSRIIQILKEHGISNDFLKANRTLEILLMTPDAVENYTRIFEETGFEPKMITPAAIANFRNVFNNQSISTLKKKHYIHHSVNPIQLYLNQFKIPFKSQEEFWDMLPSTPVLLPIRDIRRRVCSFYLSYYLKTDYEKALNVLQSNSRLQNRCFAWLMQSLDILLNDFNLSVEKIFKNSTILTKGPQHLSSLLSTVQTLAGFDLKGMVHRRPKLLLNKPSDLLSKDSLYTQNNVHPSSIEKNPIIYTLSLATTQRRLTALAGIPISRSLRPHPRFATLIYSQNKVKSRLDHLQSLSTPLHPSLHVLSAHEARFSRFLNFGETRTKGSDAIYFLADYFGISKREIRACFENHPHFLQIPLLSIQNVLDYLELHFSKPQILNSIVILLYPKEKVERVVGIVQDRGFAEEKDDFFLDMVIYLMEKDVHFTGDGVWDNSIRQILP